MSTDCIERNLGDDSFQADILDSVEQGQTPRASPYVPLGATLLSLMYRALHVARCSLKVASSVSSLPFTLLHLSSLTPLAGRPLSPSRYHLHSMSNLPPKPSLDLSLPSRPSTSTTAEALVSRQPPSLLARLSHALPPRPVVPALDTLSPRSRSPVRRDRTLREREADSYIPRGRSPEPRRRISTHRSPSPRREYWDRSNDFYVPPRSPSPPRSFHRRRESYSRTSVSPVKRYRTRSPSVELPSTFYTHSHKQNQRAQQKEEERKRLHIQYQEARGRDRTEAKQSISTARSQRPEADQPGQTDYTARRKEPETRNSDQSTL